MRRGPSAPRARSRREALKAIEDREIERVIKKQEEVGLQAITDGEFRRSWWHLDFLWGLDGVEKHVMDAGIAFAAVTTRNEGVKVTGKLGMAGPHPMVEHFKFVAAHTKRTPKITIPAPSAIYGRPMPTPIDKTGLSGRWTGSGTISARPTRRRCAASPTPAAAICSSTKCSSPCCAIRSIATQMTERGDDPEKLGPLYADLINAAMSDIPADMTITMHLCRGNYKSTFMGAGGYDAEAEVLFNQINVHGYFMEYDTERAGGFEPLRLLPKGKTVVLGLVTTKTGKLESKDELKRRIDEAAKFVRSRSALPVAAMRLRLDRGGQHADRGRAMGEAAADRRGGRRGVGAVRRAAAMHRASDTTAVIAGLDPAIRSSLAGKAHSEVMDPRVKPGGDAERVERAEQQCQASSKDKVAIVTGAGRGIGRAIAMLMAEEGANVLVNDVGAALDGSGGDAGPGAAGGRRDQEAKGGQAIASTLSIGEPANADKIVQAALDAFGRVDILVNNAGILRDKIFHRMSWSDWSDVIMVHLHGSFSMSRACATHFREQNSGSDDPHDLDLRPDRQFRPGQLHGGEDGHRRPVARHRARHGSASTCAPTPSRRSPGAA